MNSYKVKGIILAVILSLASIMMPFSVYADSYVSPSYVDNTQRDKWQNAGGNVVNFSEDPLTGSTPSKLTFTFNDNYYGFVSFQPYSGSSVWNDSTVFIAGGVGYYNYRNSSSYNPKYIDGVKITYVNLFLPDSNVDLSQIISILTAIENDTTSIDTTTDSILTDLQSVLNQIIVSNGYLETLSKLRQWNIFPESYIYVVYFLRSYNVLEYGNGSYINDINYPVFQVSADDKIGRVYLNPTDNKYLCILWTNRNIYNQTTLENYIGTDSVNGATLQYDSYVYTGYNLVTGSQTKIIKFYINVGSANETVNLVAKNSMQIIPFYLNDAKKTNFTTDFALYFGLSNTLLNNLNIIANGTTQSNSAASDLESEASEYSEIADDVIGVEEGLTSNFETEVNKIDLDSGLNVFGGNFMTSATWVRTQFDRLTENTPYGSLVIYGLTLGFALLMLGKVFL